MKRSILKYYLIIVTVFNFSNDSIGQDKIDSNTVNSSINNSDKLLSGITLSFFNAGKISSWTQFNLAFSITYKKHFWSLGPIIGPSFDLSNFKDPDCSGQADCPTLYLDYHLNYNKIIVNGLGFSYAYLFRERKTHKHYLAAFLEYSKYTFHDTFSGYDRVWTKQRFQFLVGYNISLPLTQKLNFKMNFIPGLKYYNDSVFVKNYPYSIQPFQQQKILPAIIIKLDLNYKI